MRRPPRRPTPTNRVRPGTAGRTCIAPNRSRCGHKDKIAGYCFYHGQDLERALSGSGLMLAFGPVNAELEKTEGPRVGRIVVEVLHKYGFVTTWDGTFDQRINIPKIDWKRRIA